jgi:formylglycine-generating enzyme required for sulfatase activity
MFFEAGQIVGTIGCRPVYKIGHILKKGCFGSAMDNRRNAKVVEADMSISDVMTPTNGSKAIISILVLAQLFSIAAYADPGDAFDDPIAISLGQQYQGSTEGATGTDVSRCGDDDAYDVWHSFTPGFSDEYTVSLCGSSFDTALAVFDAWADNEIACNDDWADCGAQSQLTVYLEAGETYLIRVAGQQRETGDYVLLVMAPDDRVTDGFETGSFSALPWQDQETPWGITLNTFRTGLFSARSGLISDNERSILTLTQNCKAGDVRFAVKVSSEQDCDKLIFSIDGQEIDAWSGEMDWINVDCPVIDGPHTFTWSYEKDAGKSDGQDTAWIDLVSIPWPMHDDFETGDFSLFDWQHQNTPWQIAGDSYTGGNCVQSGDIKDNENSTLSLNRYCARGTIQFAIKVSSEEQYDKLVFRIDDQDIDVWDGLIDWTEVHYPVSAGLHTFSWCYEKNEAESTNEDAAWIDDVVFTGFAVPEGPNTPMLPDSPADMNFVGIPGGTFEMGDHFTEGWFDERPVHPVILDSFVISKYETTNAQYTEYLNGALADGLIQMVGGVVYDATDSNQSEPYFDTHSASGDSQIEYGQGQFTVRSRDGHSMADHPVVKVSWYGAKAFCEYYGYRLPTEAEWEYAARGGHHNPYYKYPWGSDTLDENKANYDFHNPLGLTSLPCTTPVGRYGPQGIYGDGLCDMAGNALEWCQDQHSSYGTSASPVSNPVGSSSADYRILRGGSWFHHPKYCRTADRNRYAPFHRSRYSGFRVCVSVSAPD